MSAIAVAKPQGLNPGVESWLGRLLSWFYPGRGWGGARWMAEERLGTGPEAATATTPGRRAGGTR